MLVITRKEGEEVVIGARSAAADEFADPLTAPLHGWVARQGLPLGRPAKAAP